MAKRILLTVLHLALFFAASSANAPVGEEPPPPEEGGGAEQGDLGAVHYAESRRLSSDPATADWAASFEHLLQAAHHGHPEAQHALSAAYSTGVYHGLRVPMDPGRSLAIDYFAALAGVPEAHLSMGYRHLKGLGVPESCERAALHYEFAANHASAQIEARGYALRAVQAQLTNHIPWLSDDDNEAELIQYYDRMAQEGDVRSIHALGMLYMQGSLHTDQDLGKAARYFQMGTDLSFSASSGQLGMMLARGIGVPKDAEKAIDILQRAKRQGDPTAILALGYCYHHGIGVAANLSTALELYQSVTNKHDDAGFFTAELILENKDPHVIEVSQDGGQTESNGARRDSQLLHAAQQFYMTSANRGHILALHRIGHIGLLHGSAKACTTALNFKAVAEAGDWGHKSTIAHRKYNEGDIRGALHLFADLAYLGYESAQMNAAFILSKMYCPEQLQLCTDDMDSFSANAALCSPQTKQVARQLSSSINLDSDSVGDGPSIEYGTFYIPAQWQVESHRDGREEERSYTAMHTGHDGGYATVPHADAMECERRALALYAHSAHQGSGTAYLKVGDFNYYGLGGLSRDKTEAARYYQIAADLKNTHALFNLGIMHQTGDGVLKDFHLAKRFYDEAAVYDMSARTPSALAVAILRVHELLFTMLGESNATDFLAELSQFIMTADCYFGLGRIIFNARSYLLRAWLTLNKSVLISSSTRFESNAYSSANTLYDQAVNRLEGYYYVLQHALKRSQLMAKFQDIVSGDDSLDTDKDSNSKSTNSAKDIFNSDAIAAILFFSSVAMFMIILRYRAARRRQRGADL